MLTLQRLADTNLPTSLANRFRSARFQHFESLAALLARPIRILDVGGNNAFWEMRGWAERQDVEIVTLNLALEDKRHYNITPITGDAADLSRFEDAAFDLVFSNSVIEHSFTFERQRLMAAGVRRVGRAFYIQTPNFWFPIEPHFLVPGWQWMPVNLRIALLRSWGSGRLGPCPDYEVARNCVSEVRLLTASELRTLFPEATLVPEHFCGLVKSWTAMAGFPQA